jgi:LacI family transcriptional regulator
VPAVYQAISGSGTLSAATRERILSAARDLGFAPNTAAIAISRGRFGGIAILSSAERGRPLPSPRVSHAMQEECHARNLHLSMTTLSDSQLVGDGQLPKLLRELSVDGFLINILIPIPRMTEYLEKQRLPSVWLNVRRASDCLYPDDYDGVRRGTEHLIRLGHRRIAYTMTSGHMGEALHYSVGDRERAYLDTMHGAGLEPRLLKPDRDLKPLERAAYVRAWLSEPASSRPTAVIGYERAEGMTVLWQAHELGIDVPGQLSVMHVTEEPDEWTGRVITRLRIPQYDIGHRAVELLCRKIDDPAEPLPPCPVPLDLIPGETAGPAPT